MYHQPPLFGDDSPPPVPPEQLARRTDPDTSHAAAQRLTTGKSQCAALLREHWAAPSGLTDSQAATRAHLDAPGVCWWHRCSDLRKLGLIEWATHTDGTPIKHMGPNGREVRVSRITAAGRAAIEEPTS